jgi:CDP-diacylglycerol--serine O-phosphatidyltransferase
VDKKKFGFLSNFLTSLNLFSGFLAVLFAFEGKTHLSFYFVIFGLIFDMADGRIARSLGISSRFGLEFDSLADLVTFGLATSAIILNLFFGKSEMGKIFSFLPTLAVAIRLARFNVNSDTKPKEYFEGLSSPLGAFLIISVINLLSDYERTLLIEILAFATVVFISALQVSTLKFRSFKELKIRSYIYYFLFIPPFFLWLIIFKQKIFFIIVVFTTFLYIFYNIIFENIYYGKNLHIRHNFKGRRAGAGLFHDNRREDQNGSGVGKARS